MCTVSMVMDHRLDIWPQRYPGYFPAQEQQPEGAKTPFVITLPPVISREEFDALKREVEDLKSLLVRAKAYDEANGEPYCEMDEKVALIAKIAKLVGVDMSDVLAAKG